MPNPDWIAQLDQAMSGLADMAKMLRAYHVGLVDAGFSPEEALTLTAQFQGLTFAAGMLGQGQGE